MESFTEAMLEIIEEETRDNGNDIQKAVDVSYRRIRNMPDFDEQVELLLRKAIRRFVQDRRHSVNTSQRKYGEPAKVIVGASSAVREAMTDHYNYYIAGKTLGLMSRTDLLTTANHERNRMNGARKNVELCERLAVLVPDQEGKNVKNSVPRKKLNAIFEECMDIARVPEVVKPAAMTMAGK